MNSDTSEIARKKGRDVVDATIEEGNQGGTSDSKHLAFRKREDKEKKALSLPETYHLKPRP